MQGALRYIQEQNSNFDSANRCIPNLRKDNQAIIDVANGLQIRMLELQDESNNMLEVAQKERARQWNSKVHQIQLADQIAETTGHQYQEQKMVERLRGQLAIIKGSELSTAAEMNSRAFEQKTEIHAYKLEITERATVSV